MEDEADMGEPIADPMPGRDPTQLTRNKVLAGVRFAPLSAAGPSGQRPEHLQDMLA